MATIILHVGSPWSEDRDSLAKLFDMLERETLDPTFERYGDFCAKAEREIVESYNEDPRATAPLIPARTVHFWGNFYSYSCVFSLYTDDDELIGKLTAAIRKNKSTVAYKEARDIRKQQDADKRNRDRDFRNRRLGR
jgi:hypothetical protein